MATEGDNGSGKDFLAEYNRGFTGILHWHQLDALWERLRGDADGVWYVYAVGETPPDQPASASQLDLFITEVDKLLRAEHDHDYCGVVYVNRMDEPDLVKIFDPNHLGSSCGSSGIRILPGWVLSRKPPVDLQAAMPQTRSRRRWWQGIFSG
ncbi:hypothetical protein [Thioalkalivibrio sp.]|uniref:hypothetical protein n=1 Tax=Thioalkalivibrio sp. TaxID=2093813 RepID=UPI003976BFC0